MIKFLEDNFLGQLSSEQTCVNNILDLIITSWFLSSYTSSSDINTMINELENNILVPNFSRGNFANLKRVISSLQLLDVTQVEVVLVLKKNDYHTKVISSRTASKDLTIIKIKIVKLWNQSVATDKN